MEFPLTTESTLTWKTLQLGCQQHGPTRTARQQWQEAPSGSLCCCSDASESDEEGSGGEGAMENDDDESLPELEPNVGLDEPRDADTGTEFGMEVGGWLRWFCSALLALHRASLAGQTVWSSSSSCAGRLEGTG
jgi:hypothetical protein